MPYCSAYGCNNTNVKKQGVVIVSLPIGETRTEAVHGIVIVDWMHVLSFHVGSATGHYFTN